MTMELPEDLGQNLAPEQLRLGLALGLYVAGTLSLGRAAELAGMARLAFQRLLAEREIPLNYGLEALREDFAAIKEHGL